MNNFIGDIDKFIMDEIDTCEAYWRFYNSLPDDTVNRAEFKKISQEEFKHAERILEFAKVNKIDLDYETYHEKLYGLSYYMEK